MTRVRGVATAVVVAAVFLAGACAANADVFHMGGGLTSLEFVPVGNPGNTGELSGAGAGGYGLDRICGAVAYTFNMGKFEVTAGQYTAFLNVVARNDAYGLYNTNMADPYTQHVWGCNIQRSGSQGSYTYSVASDWANRPVNFVSWGDAARFANWLTNGQPTGAQNASTTEDGSYYLDGAVTNADLMAVVRKTPEQGGRYYIPTEDEWYKTAYHKNDGITGNYYDFPTGSDSRPSKDLVSPDAGNNANFMLLVGSEPVYTIGSPYYRTLVGEFENSESPYDTFDQGGNVWEWNEAILTYPPGVGVISSRGLRGGAFYGYEEYLHATCRAGDSAPSNEQYHIGFRVSEVPEPATMSLLALGGLGMLMRRRSVRG
ncbi:MAG: SUMF1/EgtB/PvdO family nonheme iron enzyme [Chloroflexi bacterium]|nr:SUMF1/EgtB/PvdO family nonheme iron enzyme [Chloroflexota bacterium]